MATILTDNSIAGNMLIHEALSPYIKNIFNKTRNSPTALEEDKETRIGMIKTGCLDMGSLVEQCMKLRNPKLKRVKGAQNGCDFTDGSDAKMATLRLTISEGYEKYRAQITNTNIKKGTLRCIVANTLNGEVDFFLIPHDVYIKYNNRFDIHYSPSKNTYGKYEEYRVGTFKELCS